MTGNKQWEHFIRVLAELSGSAGNARLRTALGWDEGAYDEVKGQLIDAGLVVAGRGRGGSVALSEGINEQLANGEATPEPAPPRSKAATKGARTAKQPKQATARNSGNSGNGANLDFEAQLWAAADKMRGHMDASEYKHVASASSSSNTSPTPSRKNASDAVRRRGPRRRAEEPRRISGRERLLAAARSPLAHHQGQGQVAGDRQGH